MFYLLRIVNCQTQKMKLAKNAISKKNAKCNMQKMPNKLCKKCQMQYAINAKCNMQKMPNARRKKCQA